MGQPALRIKTFAQQPVQRKQRKGLYLRQVQHVRRLQVGGDGKGIPVGINSRVDERRRALTPRRVQPGMSRGQQFLRLRGSLAGTSSHRIEVPLHMQHVLGGVVMHVPQIADIVIGPGNLHLFRGEHGRGFGPRPGKVIAIVVQIDVRILRSIEAAPLPVRKPRVHPTDDVLGYPRGLGVDIALEGMHIVLQQLRVVIQHLLEVRHHPGLVNGVAMEAPAQVVVDATQSHLLQRHRGRFSGRMVAGARGYIEQQVDGRRMGKLGLRTKAPIVAVELLQRRRHHLVDDAHAQVTRAASKVLVVFDGLHHGAGRLHDLLAASLPCVDHAAQHTLEAGTAVAVVPGKIGSSKKRLAL